MSKPGEVYQSPETLQSSQNRSTLPKTPKTPSSWPKSQRGALILSDICARKPYTKSQNPKKPLYGENVPSENRYRSFLRIPY